MIKIGIIGFGKMGKIRYSIISSMPGMKVISYYDPEGKDLNINKVQSPNEILSDSNIDVVLSDMAPNTTGNKSLDCIRTNQLCMNILEFSKDKLNKKGVVISKLFMGEDFEEIKKISKKYFRKNQFFNPHSSRDESRETYIHCSELST